MIVLPAFIFMRWTLENLDLLEQTQGQRLVDGERSANSKP
jgi:hypothetical protein